MKRPDVYQIISAVLGLATIASLGFFIFNYFTGKFGRAAVQVLVENDSGSVLINDKSFGDAPVYTENIATGDIKIQINGKENSYSTSLTPANGTSAIVTRDLGVSDKFSSGQNIWMTKLINSSDAMVSVISPKTEGVSVLVNGVEVGKSPLKFSTKDLLKQTEDSKYQIAFKKESYEEQMVEVTLKEGYQLNIRVDMFPIPVPKEVSALASFPEGVKFINFSKVSDPVFLDKKYWAKAINYFIRTRSFKQFGNFTIEAFDYFVTDNGEIYNKEGNLIKPEEMKVNSTSSVAYLGYQDKMALTDAANNSISISLNGAPVPDQPADGSGTAGSVKALFKVKITGTGSIGFLRVREAPSTSGKEVARINEGQETDVYEEKAGWYKVKTSDKEGWVSSTYTKKL